MKKTWMGSGERWMWLLGCVCTGGCLFPFYLWRRHVLKRNLRELASYAWPHPH